MFYFICIKINEILFYEFQEFKSLMGQTQELRTKLESAVRNNQQQVANLQKSINDTQNQNKMTVQQQQQQQKPSIKLKTDFSNFS